MTIQDNRDEPVLLFCDSEQGEFEKMVDSVDLRKVKEKVKNKELDLDTEQFILASLSPKEVVIRKAKEEIHKFQAGMRAIVGEIWQLMDSEYYVEEDHRSEDYSELQERLTELISHVERVKKKLY